MLGALWLRSAQISVALQAAEREVTTSAHLLFFKKKTKETKQQISAPKGPKDGSFGDSAVTCVVASVGSVPL